MSRCHIRVVFDMTTLAVLEDEWFEYDGPWERLKESSEDKARRRRMDDLRYDAFNNYYTQDLPWQRQQAQMQMDLYTKQINAAMQQSAAEQALQREYLGMQKSQYELENKRAEEALKKAYGIIDPVVSSMSPYLKGDIGFDDMTLRMMNDEAMSQISGGYDDANTALKSRMLAMGYGQFPMGGPEVRGIAELESGLADATSGARRDIGLRNAELMLQNKFNASNVLMGAGAQLGGLYGTGTAAAGGALAGYGGATRGYVNNPSSPAFPQAGQPANLTYQASQGPPGFWGGFGRNLLGMGATAGLTAGIGGLMGLFAPKQSQQQTGWWP